MFIDEAHRSVAKDLGTYLMASVPNAMIVGFTGTPIANTEQGTGTLKIFGAEDETGYLDKYSIADETTLPIKHVLEPSEMTVPVDRLDKEFFELAAAEGVTDIEELNKVLDRADALKQRVARWAIKLRVTPRLVRIQRMTRKWGSCSSAGTITLAADLLNEPDSFEDFVVAHELLHLRVPNHGRLFKALMTAHVPSWRSLKVSRSNTAAL